VSLSLKPLISPKIATTALVILLLLMVWAVAYLFITKEVTNEGFSPQMCIIQNFLEYNKLISNVVCLLITALNTLLIYRLNNKFSIIQVRTLLPVFIFLLFISVWYQSHYLVFNHLALTFFILSLLVFFNMYRNRYSTEQAFLGTLLLVTGSLILKPLILFVPICWLNFISYNCFSSRTFLASLFGMLMPWGIYLSVNHIIQPDNQWFVNILEPFKIDFLFFESLTAEFIYIGISIILGIIFLTEMFVLMKKDLRQTRAKLNIVLSFGLAATIFSLFLHNQYTMFMPFMAFSYAILFSHPLTLKLSRFNTILFILLVLTNIAYLVYNIVI
jgi:hypothetical protein